MTRRARGLKSAAQSLATTYDCAMLDLDGVVYVGDSAVAGVPEVLHEVSAQGMALAFVTNNASRPPSTVAEQLRSLGVRAGPGDVVTSAQAAARAVAERFGPGARVLVAGGDGLTQALGEHELVAVSSADDRPAAVIQGYSRDVGWAALAEATYAVRAGAWWIATNEDLTVPTARGIAPGNGTLVNAVASALGRRPDLVAGKPHRPLFDEAIARTASENPLVVGDRLDTDIAGAVERGADSLLVMTGVTDVEALCRAGNNERPDYVAWTLQGLLSPHGAPAEGAAATWALGGWAVTVEDRRPTAVKREGSADDGLRTLVATCWAWDDRFPERGLDLTGVGQLVV